MKSLFALCALLGTSLLATIDGQPALLSYKGKVLPLVRHRAGFSTGDFGDRKGLGRRVAVWRLS